MQRFLSGLFGELDRRCGKLTARLSKVDASAWTDSVVTLARHDIDRIAKDAVGYRDDRSLRAPDHLDPEIAAILSRQYLSLDREARLIEWEVVPFVERFTRVDGMLSALSVRLAREVRWPQVPPLVCTCSSSDWCRSTYYNLVFAPALEGTTLLSLPDLAHELAHALFFDHRQALVGEWTAASLLDHLQESHPDAPTTRLVEIADDWDEYWLAEIGCDLIATYLLGPAYVWQHIRLCAGEPRSIFDDSGHPADEARLQAMLRMLRKCGLEQDAEGVEALWTEYLPTRDANRTHDYHYRYPESLLGLLVDQIHAGAASLSIHEFAIHDGAETIPALLATAWRRFLADPASYAAWESQAIADLSTQLQAEQPASYSMA